MNSGQDSFIGAEPSGPRGQDRVAAQTDKTVYTYNLIILFYEFNKI